MLRAAAVCFVLLQVRSLRMAPDVIRDVLEGVLLLMGQEDTSWAAMKAFLGKRSVKEDIINYDAHRWARCGACYSHIIVSHMEVAKTAGT
jgi:hypothetical protein